MYYVYMMTNQGHRVLYIGVTNDLRRRVQEHQQGTGATFTAKYHVNQLVYFEQTEDVRVAIAREKQLKGWTRRKKEALIESKNPFWDAL